MHQFHFGEETQIRVTDQNNKAQSNVDYPQIGHASDGYKRQTTLVRHARRVAHPFMRLMVLVVLCPWTSSASTTFPP